MPVVFGYFLIAGVATVMLGPALPLLAARWGLRDAQLGTLFAAAFGGQFCGSWLAVRRLGWSLLLGAAATACGCAGLAYAGPVAGHFALLCIGLGLGAGMTAGNVVVGTLGGARGSDPEGGASVSAAPLLALLNASWGIGAIACPLLLDASLLIGGAGGERGRSFFVGLALAFAVCAALMAASLPKHQYRAAGLGERRSALPWRLLCLFGAILVLYVGVENSLGGWLPTYAQRTLAGNGWGRGMAGWASSVALCFWIGELAGRSLTALLIRRVREVPFYRGCLSVLIAAIGVLVLDAHLTEGRVFFITAVAAMSLAPLFPLGVSFLLGRTGDHPGVGRVFAITSLGGTLLPWLTGVFSSHYQSLRVGFVVPAAGAVLMLALSRYLPPGGDNGTSDAAENAEL